MTFDVPVLLLTWRRPDTTRQVLEALRLVAPSKLYVASDGPRNDAEAKVVQATRDLISEVIDWPCQIKTRFSSKNQGCQLGVSSAITWFFEQEEEGIVLEDDCVPHLDFFSYCHELLALYRDDDRVWCISGSNHQDGVWRGDGSYYFSRYNHCWGWASWRHCWSQYVKHEYIWECLKVSPSLQQGIFGDSLERFYWMEIWGKLFDFGIPDSWAYRWSLVCMANNGLTALPNKNLVKNIGFGDDATHTKNAAFVSSIAEGIGADLLHPALIIRDYVADLYSFNHHFFGIEYRRSRDPRWKLWNELKLCASQPLFYAKKLLKVLLYK